MTQYKKEFPFKNLYPPTIPKNVLAEVISNHNRLQLHCAETEKYAHVTFFFNGGQEPPFAGEDRVLVPSPKVATYDLMPTMNAAGVADEMSKAIATKKYDFVMCNFANPDMVGHTGKYEAAVVACAATDRAIGQIQKSCEQNGYTLLVTADHGNAEQMYDDKGGPFTAHTNNLVPFAISGGEHKFMKPTHHPALADVAPTVLALMSIPKPAEMTGHSLIAN
jgi:2,3-bisphosphoglycerate-independent phosphoglycerate mutase